MGKWSRHCSKYHINQLEIKWRLGADTAQNITLLRWKSNGEVEQTLLKISHYPDENQMKEWSWHCSKYYITQMKIKWRRGADTAKNIILTSWKSNEKPDENQIKIGADTAHNIMLPRWKSNGEVKQTLLKIYLPDENQMEKWSRHCSKYHINQMEIKWRSKADTA